MPPFLQVHNVTTHFQDREMFSVHKVSCDHTNVCEVSFYCFNIHFVSYFTLILDNLLCKTAGRRRFSSVSRFVSVEEGLCLCVDGELGGVYIGSKSNEMDPTKLICFKSLLFCFPIPAWMLFCVCLGAASSDAGKPYSSSLLPEEKLFLPELRLMV